jgi:paraquat-inducible protein B
MFHDIYPILPTVASGFDLITDRVARIIEKVDRVPIESIGKNLDEVLRDFSEMLDEIKSLAGVASKDLLPSLVTSLATLENTLSSIDAVISPESVVGHDFERLVADLAKAARSIRVLTERLEEHPEELLRGKAE